MLDILFTRKKINAMQKRGFTPRKLLEFSTATAQCKNVIGRSTLGKTKCWICGIPITSARGLTAECEHVLPIADAAVYLELYNKKFKGNLTKLLKKEYAWGHRICNQEKSDMTPLSVVNDKFVINERKIMNLLDLIFSSTRLGSSDLRAKILAEYATKEAFMVARTAAMKEKYDAIVNTIASGERADVAGLVLLASASALDNKNIFNPKAVPELFDQLSAIQENGEGSENSENLESEA